MNTTTSNLSYSRSPEGVARRKPVGSSFNGEDRMCVAPPELVGRLSSLNWMLADYLRHVSFLGLREDKDAKICETKRIYRIFLTNERFW